MAGQLNRGDIHIYRFAPPDKQRPVLILTRDSAIGHLSTVTVAPISSTIRGVPSEVVLDVDDGMKGQYAVNVTGLSSDAGERNWCCRSRGRPLFCALRLRQYKAFSPKLIPQFYRQANGDLYCLSQCWIRENTRSCSAVSGMRTAANTSLQR